MVIKHMYIQEVSETRGGILEFFGHLPNSFSSSLVEQLAASVRPIDRLFVLARDLRRIRRYDVGGFAELTQLPANPLAPTACPVVWL